MLKLKKKKSNHAMVAQMIKILPAMQKNQVQFLNQEDPLEKEMINHSSILAWKISWTEEPDGLQSIALQRARLSMYTQSSLSLFLYMV